MKVYLFYLDNYLYAFTATKTIAKKFMKQRCMKKLVHRVERMTESEWSHFSNRHNTSMLIENPFDTPKGCINLVTTYGEDEDVSNYITKLEDAKEDCLNNILERVGFKPKIDDILRGGLCKIYNHDSGGISINLNALAIMIYLFEPTFTGEGEIKIQRTIDVILN